MPLPKPREGEATGAFINRCISFATGEGMPSSQAVAACYSQARRAGRSVPKPRKEETMNDFMYEDEAEEQAEPDDLGDRMFNDRFMDPGYAEHHAVAVGSLAELEAEIMEIVPPPSFSRTVDVEQEKLRQP